MQLKKSIFNIEVEKDDEGNVLLFNTLNTSLGLLDKETNENLYEKLNEIENYDLLNQSSLESLQSMLNNGFVIPIDIYEQGIVTINQQRDKYSNDMLTLTIAPTLACNMNCIYCYEEKNNAHLSNNVVESIINYVNNNIGGKKVLNIIWFGGEPLLELKSIIKLSETFIKICEQHEVVYKAMIITNGLLLSRDIAMILKDSCKIERVQITLDGPADIHNSRRKTFNPNINGFEVIENNINNTFDLLNIVIRINADKDNINYLKDFVRYLLGRNKNNWEDKVSVYCYPVFSETKACSNVKGACLSNFEFGDFYAQMLKSLFDTKEFENALAFYPMSKNISCYALNINSLVIGPNGELYKCDQVVGLSDHVIGNISTGININKEFVDWMTLELPSECTECKYVPLCQGGCAHKRMMNGNRPNCEHTIKIVPEVLKAVKNKYYEFEKETINIR
ncbi:radical SAM domain protein [Clostridiales bacterium oral taxon 876 str. F0540]|nr:radical SAM domain protein [Clostridiales bacterium oral taxon 876 str. F0540]